MSIRLSSKKKKTWDESTIVDDLLSVAKAQGEERIVDAVLQDDDTCTTVGKDEEEFVMIDIYDHPDNKTLNETCFLSDTDDDTEDENEEEIKPIQNS